MPLLETDFELLETYLDGQLPMSEAEGLWQRLASDKELAATLADVRAQRAIRKSVWTDMEPDDAQAMVVSRRISSAMRRQRIWDIAQRGLTYASAAAACAFVGFRIGWMSHAVPAGNSLAQGPNPSNVQNVAMNDTSTAAPVQVAIHDQNGNLIGAPRFNTRQEAMDFVNALNATQTVASPLERRDPSNNVVPASDEQF
jgi:anti-sigma factor RsiW